MVPDRSEMAGNRLKLDVFSILRKISEWVFHDLKIRVNKYGTDAKEETTLDGNIENSAN